MVIGGSSLFSEGGSYGLVKIKIPHQLLIFLPLRTYKGQSKVTEKEDWVFRGDGMDAVPKVL
jgi:hypothetical protein